jgi:hypothetical protein
MRVKHKYWTKFPYSLGLENRYFYTTHFVFMYCKYNRWLFIITIKLGRGNNERGKSLRSTDLV